MAQQRSYEFRFYDDDDRGTVHKLALCRNTVATVFSKLGLTRDNLIRNYLVSEKQMKHGRKKARAICLLQKLEVHVKHNNIPSNKNIAWEKFCPSSEFEHGAAADLGSKFDLRQLLEKGVLACALPSSSPPNDSSTDSVFAQINAKVVSIPDNLLESLKDLRKAGDRVQTSNLQVWHRVGLQSMAGGYQSVTDAVHYQTIDVSRQPAGKETSKGKCRDRPIRAFFQGGPWRRFHQPLQPRLFEISDVSPTNCAS